MSIAATAWAWDQAQISTVDKFVLVAMADGGEGVVGPWPSEETVAYATQLTVREVRDAVERLWKTGRLACMQQAVHGGVGSHVG
jgi:hypothetical protein